MYYSTCCTSSPTTLLHTKYSAQRICILETSMEIDWIMCMFLYGVNDHWIIKILHLAVYKVAWRYQMRYSNP